jgi:hypothetical protein
MMKLSLRDFLQKQILPELIFSWYSGFKTFTHAEILLFSLICLIFSIYLAVFGRLVEKFSCIFTYS